MTKYQLNDFTMYTPETKTSFAITIPNETCLNLNGALREKVPDKMALGLHNTEMVLLLAPSDEHGVQIPRSGSIKIPDFIAQITARGIRFPARFSVIKDGDYWIGELQSQAPVHPKLKTDKAIKRSFPKGAKEAD